MKSYCLLTFTYTVEILYPLLEKIWKEEKIPEEWEEGLIIKIQKKKREPSKSQ
jgi:hypothetical protein